MEKIKSVFVYPLPCYIDPVTKQYYWADFVLPNKVVDELQREDDLIAKWSNHPNVVREETKSIMKILYLAVLAFAFSTNLWAAEKPKDAECKDGVCLVKSDTGASPVQVATDAINADAADLKKFVDAKTEAQKALDAANAAITTANAKLTTDRATLNNLLDNITTPQTVHVVQFVEIASSTCPPCNDFQPTFDKMVKAGINLRRLNADKEKSPFAAVHQTPSWIATVDGKEVSRVESYLGEEKITDWYKTIVEWSKTQK